MSVRRLADEAVQPDAFAFSADNAAWAEAKLKDYPAGRQASAVIPLLMRAQEQDGWVTKAAIEHVADMLEMPLIRVLEVATFYTQRQGWQLRRYRQRSTQTITQNTDRTGRRGTVWKRS